MQGNGLPASRQRLKLRNMSDDDLWWIFLHHRQECGTDFWREVENRKAACILSPTSALWMVGESTVFRQAVASGSGSNLIELTAEEWEGRRRRKIA